MVTKRLHDLALAIATRLLRVLDPRAVVTGAGIALHNTYRLTVLGPDGLVKGQAVGTNITVNVGLNDLLTQYFKGSGYTAGFFVGLKGAGTPSAADTMASHGTWAELTSYSQATRPALVLGSVASQAVNNAASKATFTVTGPMTVTGAFVSTNNTVGGTSGTLFGVADFQATGTVNTSGTAVTYASGTQFSAAWNGQTITINSVNYTITTVNSSTSITLSSSAGTQTGVAYSTVNTKLPSAGDSIAVEIDLSAATA